MEYIQAGFDFSETDTSFSEDASGTWINPRMSWDQYASALDRAEAVLLSRKIPFSTLYLRGIATQRNLRESLVRRGLCTFNQSHCLWSYDLDYSLREMVAFGNFCEKTAPISNVKCKSIVRPRCVMSGLFIDQIGTLKLSIWQAGDSIRFEYHPWLDALLLDSAFDDVSMEYLPYRVWGSKNNAARLSEANRGVASVLTFPAKGREFVHSGSISCGSRSECTAWSFSVLSDWAGPTYSYATLRSAWDDGRKQRGDMRGLIVNVRGQQCALDGAASFFDDNVERSLLIEELIEEDS